MVSDRKLVSLRPRSHSLVTFLRRLSLLDTGHPKDLPPIVIPGEGPVGGITWPPILFHRPVGWECGLRSALQEYRDVTRIDRHSAALIGDCAPTEDMIRHCRGVIYRGPYRGRKEDFRGAHPP